ncbi:MAG: ExbD/TolR family protein [Kofleriaceae bacterium]
MSFTQREARRVIRKAVGRVPEGEEIRHLNIMPMMDMMTILLVAFIFQAATTATAMHAGTVNLPRTLSDDELPENATTLIITKSGITIDGEATGIAITNGTIDPAAKEGGTLGLKIPRLTKSLAYLYQLQETARRKKPGYDPATAEPPELMIIADRTTPYRVLVEVMFSAKEQEGGSPGYKRFRLIVQKSYPATGK